MRWIIRILGAVLGAFFFVPVLLLLTKLVPVPVAPNDIGIGLSFVAGCVGAALVSGLAAWHATSLVAFPKSLIAPYMMAVIVGLKLATAAGQRALFSELSMVLLIGWTLAALFGWSFGTLMHGLTSKQ